MASTKGSCSTTATGHLRGQRSTAGTWLPSVLMLRNAMLVPARFTVARMLYTAYHPGWMSWRSLWASSVFS